MEVVLFHKAVHVNEDQLLPVDPKCPFCGSLRRTVTGVVQKGPDVEWLSCLDCHAVSASRFPTTRFLQAFYGGYYSSPSFSPENRVTLDSIDRMARHIQKALGRGLQRQRLSILDFGGGDGSVAAQLANSLVAEGCSEITITVVDYNQTLAQADDSRIHISRVETLADAAGAEYDLVLASAVIEHLPEPRQDLWRLLSLIRIGGYFYARTPRVVPLWRFASFFGQYLDLGYPGHLHDLGRDFWDNVFRKPLEERFAFDAVVSQPSVVETCFRRHFWRTLIAYCLKAPAYLVRSHYELVGGWEVFARRRA